MTIVTLSGSAELTVEALSKGGFPTKDFGNDEKYAVVINKILIQM
ncbi:MAG: hypothetical protein AB1480_16470 [Nitrospirota bacterium]